MVMSEAAPAPGDKTIVTARRPIEEESLDV
jgi:hypothetical protein